MQRLYRSVATQTGPVPIPSASQPVARHPEPLYCSESSTDAIPAPSAASSQLHVSRPPPGPPRTRRASEPDLGSLTPQGEAVTRALAIKVDEECLDRWGEALYDNLSPGRRANKSPEEFREALSRSRLTTIRFMTYEVYCNFPNVPRLERSALLVRCPRLSWLFVFKDNSSQECLHAQVDPADIEAVQEYLGVKKESAKWYKVAHHI
ncbi:hypothetical protein C8T65DRAFT_656733 [Cerioporus squamosus]|nr:hypothetical protein C8T65DRAFT_656733 [Cerioporus squamosus]